MCGPTLVFRQGQSADERVYCRSCNSEYVTVEHEGKLIAVATGQKGTAKDLEPEADTALIARLVRESAEVLATSL